jgi:hypothetical protein
MHLERELRRLSVAGHLDTKRFRREECMHTLAVLHASLVHLPPCC